MTEIEFVNLDRLIRILAVAGSRAVPVLGQALLEEAHLSFRRSQAQVPYRFGILKSSGRVDGPKVSGMNISVELSYGGAASAYAYIMHQGIMHGRPINYRNGKKSAYLYDPVKASVAGMDARIGRRIEAIFNG